MASLFAGLSTISSSGGCNDAIVTQPPPAPLQEASSDPVVASPPDASSASAAATAESTGSALALSGIPEEPPLGLSAFSFISASGDSESNTAGSMEAGSAEPPAFPFMSGVGASDAFVEPSSGRSVFEFLSPAPGPGDSDYPAPADVPPAVPQAPDLLSIAGGFEQAAQAPLPVGSAFGFLNGADATRSDTAEAALDCSAPPSDLDSLGGAHLVPMGPAVAAPLAATRESIPAPVETGPRKKTRKALLPGHASRAAEAKAVAPDVPRPAPHDWSAAEAASGIPDTDSHVNEELEKSTSSLELKHSQPPAPVTVMQESNGHTMPPAPAASESEGRRESVSSSPTALRPSPLAGGLFQGLQSSAPGEANDVVGDSTQLEPHAKVGDVFAEADKQRLSTAESPSATTTAPSPSGPPPPPPLPRPQLNPGDELDQTFNTSGIKVWLQRKTAASLEDQRTILESQSTCLCKSQEMTKEIDGLRQKLASVEAEQNRLCDDEKFDEAGALDSSIQELKGTIMGRLEEVAAAGQQAQTLARDLLQLAQDRETFAQQAIDRTSRLLEESEASMKQTSERNDRRLSVEAARIDAERSRVELVRSHLERVTVNLEEEWEQVTAAIDQQTTVHSEERDRAKEKRATLDEEIFELESELERKREERRTVTEVVDACEIRIASIRSRFEKQLVRLEEGRRRQDEAQRDFEQDMAQVQQSEKELGQERENCKEGLQQCMQQIREIRVETRSLLRHRRIMSRTSRIRAAWQRLMEPHEAALNEARRRWEQASGELSALSASSAEHEAEAAKLRDQIDAIRLQLPSLEAEKKMAIASRSFKEAGRMAEEIKKREEEHRKFEEGLERLQGHLNSAREALVNCRHNEESAQSAFVEAEAHCASEELRVQRRQARDLELMCKRAVASQTENALLEQERRLVQRSQENLVKKYDVDVSTLEEIPSEPGEESEEDDVEDLGEEQAATNGFTDHVEASPTTAAPPPPPPADGGAMDSPRNVEPAATACCDSPASRGAPLPEEPGAKLSPSARRSELQKKRAELMESATQRDGRIEELEDKIGEACSQDEFDLAEELEEERKALVLASDADRQQLENLEALLTELVSEDDQEPSDDPGEKESQEKEEVETAERENAEKRQEDSPPLSDNEKHAPTPEPEARAAGGDCIVVQDCAPVGSESPSGINEKGVMSADEA